MDKLVERIRSGGLLLLVRGAVSLFDLPGEGSKERGADLRLVRVDEAESVAVARLRREHADIETDFEVLGNEIAEGFRLLDHGF